MEAVTHHHHHLHLSVDPRRPSLPWPVSSVRLLKPLPIRRLSVRASSSRNPSHKPSILLQASCAAIAAAAVFLGRFHHRGGRAVATPMASESAKATEQGVEELRSAMEAKIKANKLEEAVEIVNRLIELEPREWEWVVLRANLYSYLGEHEAAAAEFEEMLRRDPLRVEAYHGLVMAASESGDSRKVSETMERAEAAMRRCDDKSEVRDFKLLVAQVKVMERKYAEALKVYGDLQREEPRDFRPYLCQGIIHSLLSNQSEAEKNFDTFRRLVPKNHPYREHFEDNMFATKLYSQAQKESIK